MLRAVLFAALVLSLALPGAAALPIPGGVRPSASLALGPDGLADPTRGDPYYLWLTAQPPTPPHPSDGKLEDCSPTERPAPVEAARGIVEPILLWKPLANVAFSGWFPQCIAAELSAVCAPSSALVNGCLPLPGKFYASYDVTDGSYFVSASVPTPLGLKPTAQYGGSSGVGMRADCLACPQPP